MLFGYKILIYVTSNIHKEEFANFISELNDKLIAQNWRIFTFSSDSDFSRDDDKDNKNTIGRKKFFELINFDIVDALIISEARILDQQLKESLYQKAKSHNIPVINMGGKDKGNYNICFNQTIGFEKLVRHIVEDHHVKDLHFIGGTPDSEETLLRLEAFKRVLAENNIPFRSNMVSYGYFWDLPTIKVAQELIDYGKMPEAIICANDTMAIAVNSVLERNNISCPEDVIVTGYDGISAIYYSSPKITSVSCDSRKIANETAEFLFDIMENAPAPYTKYVEPSLYLSESCGCKKKVPIATLGIVNDVANSFNRYRADQTMLDNLSVKIRESRNVEELIANVKHKLFYNVICVVKEECLDKSKNPAICCTDTPYGEKLFVLLDSDSNLPSDNRPISIKELLPRMQSLLEDYKHPLIFAPINDADIPLGYLCFCFLNYDKQNFAKVHQTGFWLGRAISEYRYKQYQEYLQEIIQDFRKK